MKHILRNNLGSKQSLLMKFGQLVKKFCKKKCEEACILIWTNLDSFAITYLIICSVIHKLHFPIEVVPNPLQMQKGLEVVFRL